MKTVIANCLDQSSFHSLYAARVVCFKKACQNNTKPLDTLTTGVQREGKGTARGKIRRYLMPWTRIKAEAGEKKGRG